MSGRTLTVHRLGRVEYEDGLRLQALFARARKEGGVGDVLLLLEHPPVLTLGRGASRADVLAGPEALEARGVEVHETDRGGEVTYHGPGQIVGYPILDLAPDRKDVRRHVRSVEEGMIRALAEHGIEAARIAKWPGVWVGSEGAGDARKIGAVGVHIARWITTHGFALNVNTALEDFQLIVPCGIREAGVTSMERELGRPVHVAAVEESLARAFGAILEADVRSGDAPTRTVSVTAVRRGSAGPEVLLLRRTPERGGFWQPVTGRVMPGESAESAARRELEEETGARLAVRSLRYRHGFAFGNSLPPQLFEEEAFAADWPGGLEARQGPEHDAAEWVSLEHALARVRFSGLRRAIRRTAGAPAGPTWR
ncbi:MAG TPA: lipoyl(octanoyl) transferase LipB [Myxococcaceae bacterium]|nr:lipoyl(octanoyl) transferase LipB [Myxococcaceae bacterium]